jgi:hypothetical protein
MKNGRILLFTLLVVGVAWSGSAQGLINFANATSAYGSQVPDHLLGWFAGARHRFTRSVVECGRRSAGRPGPQRHQSRRCVGISSCDDLAIGRAAGRDVPRSACHTAASRLRQPLI